MSNHFVKFHKDLMGRFELIRLKQTYRWETTYLAEV